MRSGVLALVAGAALAVAGCSQVNAQKGQPEYRYGYGYAYGPGAVMGGPGGYGPMMGGPGYGPMMGAGPDTLPDDLTAEQREKIAAIRQEFRARQFPLMQQMHENMLEQRRRIDEVLGTKR